MIKIIEEGQLQGMERFECIWCDCIFESNEGERSYNEEGDLTQKTKCPCCGAVVTYILNKNIF